MHVVGGLKPIDLIFFSPFAFETEHSSEENKLSSLCKVTWIEWLFVNSELFLSSIDEFRLCLEISTLWKYSSQ